MKRDRSTKHANILNPQTMTERDAKKRTSCAARKQKRREDEMESFHPGQGNHWSSRPNRNCVANTSTRRSRTEKVKENSTEGREGAMQYREAGLGVSYRASQRVNVYVVVSEQMIH